jgi:hypothetical protein
MKKLFIVILSLISLVSNSQITVDTTTNWVSTNLEVSDFNDSLFLDVNVDGTNDLLFKTIVDPMFGNCIGFNVTTLNGSEVLILSLDTLYPFGMQINDIVQYSSGWKSVVDAVLVKDESNTVGYFYPNQIHYLGVKIDTLYGYVGILPSLYLDVMKIKGYAFEGLFVSIDNFLINNEKEIDFIYDINGRFIGKNINTTYLPNGVYIIVDNNEVYKKFIIN